MLVRTLRLARYMVALEDEQPPNIRVYSVEGKLVARATVGDMVVGLVSFNRDGKFVTADDLWVRKSFRRRGIASQMYQAVEQKGYTIEPSDTLTPEGQAFWKKRGLSESDAERRHVVPGAHPLDALFGE